MHNSGNHLVIRTVTAVTLSAIAVLVLAYLVRAALLFWFTDTGRL